MKYNYQLIIIGAGSGGLTAADLCVELGLTRVLLIEKDQALGGECLHSGCVPSKSLLYIAKSAVSQDKQAPWKYVQKCISAIEERSDNDAHYTKQGIQVAHGEVTFANNHTIEFANGKQVTSKYFLIATGSKPQIPPIPGLELTNHHTNETIFKLRQTPDELIIIGGGPIGCEMATAFGQLGTKVTLVQRSERLLPREEPKASQIVLDSLRTNGVKVILNASKTEFTKNSGTPRLTVTIKDETQTLDAPHVLIAAGRIPIVPLGAKEIGITTTDTGITINKYFQTNHSNIYAIGDCTPSLKFTHLAGYQASVAVRNMLSPFKSSSKKLQTIPWITFTDPEVARLGITASEADPHKHQVLEMPLSDIDRAITDDNTSGYMSVVVDSDGHILGATIVGKGASELLAPLSLLYYQNRSITDLGSTVIAYPTLASGLNILALRYLSKQTKQKSYWSFVTRSWR